ncbi:putative nucleotidyltransferase substrate binding domain-containing protein [Fundidesulfovibrio soli]|uniref:putative nucleotidyltransferase substrate binding domain-containing protein n=1 Tax=Fundidesulfovibrio soli TaxID=2922716 RepID=UPI001FAE77AF|nr:putative nucleotidyltransferase substrate binding domain-containing protein [Fundidesulfovibrio soli]
MTDGEEGFLGLKVGSLALKAPVFAQPGTTLGEAAREMRAARLSACLVGTPQAVQGILTERDIVWAVADGVPPEASAGALMTEGLVSVGIDELVSEAFLLMIRHNIRRLGVTDAGGDVVALLEERDLMAARLESPVALSAAIARADGPEELARAAQALGELLPRWLTQGAGVARAGALAAAVRDQLFTRAAELALEGGGRPGPFALVALGSEGRREQFLSTDQDNALVLGEGSDEALAEGFARRLMDILERAGLPPCQHGVTADHAAWRMSLPAWRQHLDALGRDLGPDAVLALSLLADARHILGERALSAGLRAALRESVAGNSRALRYMAREAVRFEPPLSIFGALLTERGGPEHGGLDIKRGGIFPLTQGARVLDLDLPQTKDSQGTDSASRLRRAAQAGVIGEETVGDLTQALDFMQELRLRFQAMALATGREPGNHVRPELLSRLERARLKECFKAVAAFQAILSNRYALHLLT